MKEHVPFLVIASLTISFALSISLSLVEAYGADDPEPWYQDKEVIIGIPAGYDYWLFQDDLSIIDSWLGIELTVEDSLLFICTWVYEEDEIDMAVRMNWQNTGLSGASVEDVVTTFQSFGYFAEPDYLSRTFQNQPVKSLTPPPIHGDPVALDPYARFQNPYELGSGFTQVIQSWSHTNGTEEVVVQIIDTGGFWWHPEFNDRLWENGGEDADGDGSTVECSPEGDCFFDPGDQNGIDDDGNGVVDDFIGWDFKNFDNDPSSGYSWGMDHGTAVGSVAGARSYNGTGMLGVMQDPVRLEFIKAGASGYIWNWYAMQALGYAINTNLWQGTHVVTNISWGSHTEDLLLKHQLDCFVREGGLPVFAAGNFGDQRQTFPAGWHFGPIVTASDSSNQMAPWSTHGDWVWPDGLASPGSKVIVMRADTDPWGDNLSVSYERLDGTSFSAPLIAAGAANFWSVYPNMTNEEVRQAVLWAFYQPVDYLINNPDPSDYWAFEAYYGKGIFNQLYLVTYN